MIFIINGGEMEELGIILQNLDWSPLWISLKTGVVATFF